MCSPCSAGKFAKLQDDSSVRCSECDIGKWSNIEGLNSSDQCFNCPLLPGAACPSGSAVPYVSSGWFRDIKDGADVLINCLPEEACLEAGFGNTTCSSEYTGKGCSDCSEGYFRLSFKCRKCLSDALRFVIIFLGLACAMFMFWKLSAVQEKIPISIRITFNWIQFLSLYAVLTSQWPSALSAMFNFTNIMNGEIQYFGFTCQKGLSFWSVWVGKLLLPVIMFSSMLGFTLIRMRKQLNSTVWKGILLYKIPGIMHAQLLLSTLTFNSLFQIFNCTQQSNGIWTMVGDPSVQCFDSQWKGYLVLDIFGIIGYVLILPTAGLFYVLRNANNPAEMEALRPFTSAYRSGCEYWDFVRLGYKLIFVVFRSLPDMDFFIKSLLMLTVLAGQSLLEGRMLPYKKQAANELSAS
jgi:hypothetical protein